jgi:hypothetical protein
MDEMASAVPASEATPGINPVPPSRGRGSVFAADLVGRGNWSSYLTWAVLFSGPLAVLITAAMLTPDPAGHGTHTQLGLPPCGFLVFTGYPCPGCGLTTSFSHMIRLQIFGAAQANPFGILLFTATAVMVPLALMGIIRRMPVIDTLDRLHAEKIAIGLSILSLLVWGTRVSIQYLGA